MKTEINLSNYEAFAIDFIDGNLRGATLLAFQQFLALHPEIQDEMDDLASIPKLNKTFTEKLAMMQLPYGELEEITLENVDSFFIASLEHDLSANLMTKLDLFLDKNPDKRNDYELFKRIKLNPSNSFEYHDKAKLFQVENFEMSLYEYNIIAALEGDALLADDENRSKIELDLYKKTIQIADTAIVFPNKSSLFKTNELKFIWLNGFNQMANIAASLIAILLFVSFESLIRTEKPMEIPLIKKNSELSFQLKSNELQSSMAPKSVDAVLHPKPSTSKVESNNDLQETEIAFVQPIQMHEISTQKATLFVAYAEVQNFTNYYQQAQLPSTISEGLNEKVISKNPILYFASTKIRNLFQKEQTNTHLDVNWQNAAMAGLSGIGKLTESELILSMVGDRASDEIVTIKQK